MAPNESMLAFDIETYGAWSELTPRMQGYLTRRDQQRGLSPGDSRASPQRVSLLPGLAQVVTVGLWSSREERGVSLQLEPGAVLPERRETCEGGEVVFFASEADLLGSFWERVAWAVARDMRLVTFNGRGFDVPILTLRSSVLGVAPSIDLTGSRRALRPHCDLSEVLTLFGASRTQLSLDYWCEVYGVNSPKTQLNGREVGPAYERREYKEIAQYALRDARATAEIFLKIADTVIRLLEESDSLSWKG